MNDYGSKLSHSMLSTFLFRSGAGFNYKTVNAINSRHVIASNRLKPSASTKSHHIPPHGIFIDSCHSHCNTCFSRGGKDMSNIWVSKKITTQQNKNPIDAFSEWYSNTLLLQGDEEQGHTHNQQLFAKFFKYQHETVSRMYIQNKPFPCDDCCDCS